MNESEMMSTTPAMVFEALSERESFMGFMPPNVNPTISPQYANNNNASNNSSITETSLHFTLDGELDFDMDITSPIRETWVVPTSNNQVTGQLKSQAISMVDDDTPTTTITTTTTPSKKYDGALESVKITEASTLKDLGLLATPEEPMDSSSEFSKPSSVPVVPVSIKSSSGAVKTNSGAASREVIKAPKASKAVEGGEIQASNKVTRSLNGSNTSSSRDRDDDAEPPSSLISNPTIPTTIVAKSTTPIVPVSVPVIPVIPASVASPMSSGSAVAVDAPVSGRKNNNRKAEGSSMVPTLVPKTGNPFAPAGSQPPTTSEMESSSNVPAAYSFPPSEKSAHSPSALLPLNATPAVATVSPPPAAASSAQLQPASARRPGLSRPSLSGATGVSGGVGGSFPMSSPAAPLSAPGSGIGGSAAVPRTNRRQSSDLAASLESAGPSREPHEVFNPVGSSSSYRFNMNSNSHSMRDVESALGAAVNMDTINQPTHLSTNRPGHLPRTQPAAKNGASSVNPNISIGGAGLALNDFDDDGASTATAPSRISTALPGTGGTGGVASRMTISSNTNIFQNTATPAAASPTVSNFNEACQWLVTIGISPVNFKLPGMQEEQLAVNLKFIRGLVTANRETFRKFSNPDRCDVVTKIYKRYSAVSAVICEECLGLLVVLCKSIVDDLDSDGMNDDHIKLLGLNGCLTDLVPVLSKYGKLSSLDLDPTIASMKTAMNIAKFGCSLIRNLATNVNHNGTLGREGVCECIVDIVFHHLSSTEVVTEGLMCIMNLAYNSDNTLRLCSAGATSNACKLVPLALLRHLQETSLVQWGCLALVNLSADDAQFRVQLGRCGACDTLQQLLILHSESSVAQYICLAMGTLAQSVENRPLLMTQLQQLQQQQHNLSGMAEAFLKILTHHSLAGSILECFMTTVANLVQDTADNQVKIGKVPELLKLMVTSLKDHLTEASLTEKTLLAIHRLVQGVSYNRDVLAECGLYECMVDVLSYHNKEISIAQLGMTLINELNQALDSAAQATTMMIKPKPNSIVFLRKPAELLSILVTIMQTHGISSTNSNNNNSSSSSNSSSSGLIVEQSFKLIGFLSFVRNNPQLFSLNVDVETLSAALAEYATCQLLVKLTERYLGNVTVVRTCCTTMAQLASADTNCRAVLGSSKACYVVIQALKSHTKTADVSTVALMAIHALAEDHPENRGLFGVEGACESIVSSMKTHIHNGAVVRAAAGAVIHMVQSDETNLSQLIASGACETLVQGLFVHLTDPIICERLLRTVYAICLEDKSTSSGVQGESRLIDIHANKSRLNQARVCSALVALLHCHGSTASSTQVNSSSNSQVAEETELLISWIFRVMSSLSLMDVLRAKFGSATICQLLLQTIQGNMLIANISHAGYLTIGNIAYDSTVAATLGNLGACEVLVQSLKIHFADAGVTEQCLWAMKNLSAVDTNQERFYDAGTCAIIIRALRTHMENAPLIERVFEVIMNLCCYNKNRTAFGEAGACSLVLDIFRNFMAIDSLAYYGCCVIGNLAYNNQENRKKLTICQVNDLLKNFHACYIDTENFNDKYQAVYRSVNPV